MGDTSRRVRPVNNLKHLYKYFANFDIKCSQNQTLEQADLDLSFIKVWNIKAMKFMTIFFYLGGPSSLPGSLKLIYFVKVTHLQKRRQDPLQNLLIVLKNPPPPLANLKQPFFPLFPFFFPSPHSTAIFSPTET